MHEPPGDPAGTAGPGGIDVLGVGHAPVLQINRRMYRALARMGWRVELAIPAQLPWPSEPVQPDDPEDPPIHRLPVKGRVLRTWSFEGLPQVLDSRAPRIVYLENGPDSRMAWFIGRWCARNGAKLVVNTNENDIPPVLEALAAHRIKPALRSLRTRLWLLFTKRHVAHVVAISEEGRDTMRTVGFGDAVSVTPLGYDRALFYPDEAQRAKMRARLGLHQTVVAYFGRLAPHKGVHLLISALGRLTHLPWQFLIDDFLHSSDGYAERLRAAIGDAGIADRTIFFTSTHDEMPDYMRAADIVAVPSTWREQYGRVAPEAMACGCIVVVSNIGALPELVGSAGVTVPPNDVDALADAISRLMADPDRCRTLGTAAAERAKTLLSIDRQVTLLDQLFRCLTGAGPSDGPGAASPPGPAHA